MVNKKTTCTCTTCGYAWPRGRDGSHSCAEGLANHIKELVDLLERSISGLKWYKTEHPKSWSEADEEHLTECRNALASK